jgi:hypothetical protein
MGARQQRSSVVARLLWCAALVCLASACGSSSISVTTPSGAKCSVSVTNSMSSVPAAGAAGTLTISTNRDCTWSASTTTPWISITSSGTGQGEATLTYRVAANVDPSPRHGIVTVNDATVDVTQEPAPCRFTVTPSAAASPAAGGSIEITVGASSAACAWTAVSSAAWITVAGESRGSGNGTVTLNVLPNGGDGREGRVVVADLPVTISQPSVTPEVPTPTPLPAPNPTPTPTPTPAHCTYALDPPSQTVGASGGSGTIAVSSGSGCTWTATTTAPWVTITGGATGEGSGTVAFTAAANSGAARSATIQIGAASATITQPAASCSYTIAPTSQAVAAAGGTGSVAVTAGANCSWSVTKEASWISITSGANGTGNGTVQFSVGANPGQARSAALTIAGRTFTVTQAANACSFSIAPRGQSIGAGGGTGTVAVTAASGCSWKATANANWLTITSTASGSGDGSITFSAAANTGSARTGTLTIAGETFTVEQDGAACTFSLSATNLNVGAGTGTGSVTVTAPATCAWTAVSNAPWITVTSGASGTGAGTVAFSVAANSGAARSGTLTIAGRTFTVAQEGASCGYSISPSNQNVAAAGGTGSVAVSTAGGCAWTATSNAGWLSITGAASGTGNGSVSFSVAANTGSARTGTLTIAGQTFTIVQEAAATCAYAIAPTSQNVSAAGGRVSVTVTTGATCAWTATSTAEWIIVTGEASGTGNGSVAFIVVPNLGDARTGTLTIAGQTFTLRQSGL